MSTQLVDRAGTVRRVQALSAMGWTRDAVAARMGVSTATVNSYVTRTGRVEAGTAARVAAVYDQMWAVRPSGWIADRTRQDAARRGYAPPLAWDDDSIDDPAARPVVCPRPAVTSVVLPDEVAVARLVSGAAVAATPRQRRAAALVLSRRGLSAREVAERLGMTRRSVQRYLSVAA